MKLIVVENENIISNTIVDQLPKFGDNISIRNKSYYVVHTMTDVSHNLYSVKVMEMNNVSSQLFKIDPNILRLIKGGFIG